MRPGNAPSVPVRVLLLSDHPVPYAVPLYQRYAKSDRIDLTVLFLTLEGAEATYDAEFGIDVEWDIPLLEGYHWVHPPNRSPKPAGLRFWGAIHPGALRVVMRGDYDVVVSCGYRAASYWIARLAAALTHTKWVWSSETHRWGSGDGSTGWKARLKRVLVPLIYRSADASFALSTPTRVFLEGLGVPREKIFLTPYVVDNERFASTAARADAGAVRRSWGVPDDALLALACGKLIPIKRPFDAVEAIARVPGAHLVFVGEGGLRPQLEERVAELGVRDWVHFVGFINQAGLPEAYAAADVLLVTSEAENYPLVAAEALATGLPVIATDTCAATGDVVLDDQTGYVISVGDVSLLAEKMLALARDRSLLRRLSKGAAERMETWGLDDNVEAFVSACVAIASPQQPPAAAPRR